MANDAHSPERRTLLAAGALGLVLGAPAQAQDSGKAARDLALYQGADRTDKLLALAKNEGELSVYHVYPSLPVVMAAFTKKYDIKIKAWRAGSEAVLQRLIAEAHGGRFDVDVVQNNAPENEAAYREKLLQPVWSPGLEHLVSGAAPAHHAWAGITLDIYSAAYNTGLIQKEQLPKTYPDLLDPRWKGRLAVEANDEIWFGALLDELGEAAGKKLFEDIVAINGITVRKGHSALTNLVASGDVPLALTTYSWIPEQLKKKGAPVENWVIQPLLAQPSTIAVLKRAANPASALLFYDFMLGEGQQLLANAKYVPASRLIPGPMAGVPVKLIDPARALDMQQRWFKLFDEMIVKKAR